MLWRLRAFPDFCEPCLPSPAAKPPAGAGWLHEIKHDGFRMLVRRDAAGVRLFTRNGHDWTERFPLIAQAALELRATSCLIDGEAVACDDKGLPVFDRLRYRRQDGRVFLYAFDLIELDGNDLRRERIERRKVLLIRLLAKAGVGLQVNDHIVEAGDVVFRHACQLGFEGIVSTLPTSLAVRARGSSSRTQWRQRSSARRKRTGAGADGDDQNEDSLHLPRRYLDA